MKDAITLWVKLRGCKRQAGAIIALVPVIAGLFGLEIPKEWNDAAITIGTLIWGIGWADRGAREVVTKLGGTKQ